MAWNSGGWQSGTVIPGPPIIGGLTSNRLLKIDSSSQVADSSLTDDGSTVTSTVPVLGPNGLVGAPTYSFTNGSNEGMFLSDTNNLSFAVNGVLVLNLDGGGPNIGSGMAYQFRSAAGLGGSVDTILARAAAANFRLGAAAANPPVAQTLSMQNASGTDIAGADFTLDLSQGTGTGTGGGLIVRSAAAGGAGSSLNALATLLTVGPTNVTLASGQLLLPDGTPGAPGAAFANGTSTGLSYNGGYLFLSGSGTEFMLGANLLRMTSTQTVGWTAVGSDLISNAADTILARAAAATPYFYGSSTAVGATLRLGNTNVGYEDFARNSEAHTLAAAGTSTTATAVWPAGSGSQAAAFRITTEITGCTSVQVGVAGDTTRYGTFNTLTVGQTIAIGRIDNYAAETGVLFTAVGGGASFTAGVVRVNLRYITASASTS